MADPGRTPFANLRRADLVLDHVYEGGRAGTVGDDPLARLLPVGNQGGFRYKGSPARGDVCLVVLYTTGAEPSWPDVLDPCTGDFAYWGDNRSAGAMLNQTQRQGNRLLEVMFGRAGGDASDRSKVCPFLLFEKAGPGRDVRFRGLLAPGSARLAKAEQLVAVWRTSAGTRFQNYRAHFTVLNEPRVSREWIEAAVAGDFLGPSCPPAWRQWVADGTYQVLAASPTVITRSPAEQLPATAAGRALIETIHQHFTAEPTGFEHFAAELWSLAEPRAQQIDVTRPSRDGGRDATGTLMIGPAGDPVAVDFALEAKCYAPTHSVGVRELSRLISRLRHRQFGVLVTTSYVHNQAYTEIRTDGHPVVIISAADIVAILNQANLADPRILQRHLDHSYPAGHPRSYGVLDRARTTT